MLGSSKAMMIDPEASISSHGRNIALSMHLEQVMTVCDTVMPAESKTGVSCKSRFQDENLHQLATELRSQPGHAVYRFVGLTSFILTIVKKKC